MVDEAGAVGSVDESGYFEGFGVLVEAGVQDFEDGYAGEWVEGLCFLVAGHAGDDFVLAADHGVAAFFQPAVDAAGSGVGLQQWGVLSVGPADVGGDDLQGLVVGVVGVAPTQDRGLLGGGL